MLCVALVLQAQYSISQTFNRTYFDGQGESVDIVNAGAKGVSCVLGRSANFPIILKKLDFNGNVIFDKSMSFNPPGANIYATKLLHTPNDEYLVVGFIYDNGVRNPFASRFDANGNILWFNKYFSNTRVFPLGGSDTRVNICRIEDDGPSEAYIITAAGDDPYGVPGMSGTGDDVFINALRIDGSGNCIWNHKFIRTGAPYTSIAFDNIDCPESLVFINNTVKRYFIGGGTNTTGGGPIGFFMSIDKNGVIADQYANIPSSEHWWEEAIYDNATQQVITGYPCGNIAAGITSSNSAAGISKFSVVGGLTHVRSDFFALAAPANETYCMGIKEDATHTFYILAAFVATTTSPVSHMALMKVRKTTPGSLSVFKDYNVQRLTFTAGVIDAVNASGTENYVLAGTANGVPNAMRVISTDVNGIACGANQPDYTHNNPTYTCPVSPLTQYNITPSQQSYGVIALTQTGSYSDCDAYVAGGGNAAQYRTTPTNINETGNLNSLKVYPTLLTSQQFVSLDINAEGISSADVIVTTIDGKVIGRHVLKLSDGANHLQITIPEFAAGTYVLRVSTKDGAINKTFKLSRL